MKKSIYVPDHLVKKAEGLSFGHQHYVDAICETIIDTQPPFTVGIFGGWGTGKSSMLGLVQEKLKKEGYKTVFIDVWRYSSAENLKRAFLARVSYEVDKTLIADVTNQLYSRREERKSPKGGVFARFQKEGEQAGWVKTAWRFIWEFASSAILSMLVIFFLLILYVFLNSWLSIDSEGFSLQTVFSLFEDYLFVPFFIALFSILRPFIANEPIVITSEPIDADEIFADLFNKIVSRALRRRRSKNKRLVIFIDNLDRLGNKLLIEALEALKAYLVNQNCVFVVAADDNVVRSVINMSEFGSVKRWVSNSDLQKGDEKEEDNSSEDNEAQIEMEGEEEGSLSRLQEVAVPAGEEYLDKFFQQTFRLPPHMEIGLQDFALEAFGETLLFDELKKQGVDIPYLISIIIPGDVGSPRKAKRLLNEFITLFNLARRREQTGTGQLLPAALTGNPYILAKFSTLRAEYPEFYLHLVKDPSLLTRLTLNLQKSWGAEKIDGTEEIDTEEHWLSRPKGKSLLAYLRRTEQFIPKEREDPGKFIWLSQDPLTVELGWETVNQLRQAIQNADHSATINLLREGKDNEEKFHVVQAAQRYLQSHARGIERLNGAKVLAHMLGEIEEQNRQGPANIAATIMCQPQPAEGFFTAAELLVVLESMTAGDKERLLAKVFAQLEEEKPQDTFASILEHAPLIRDLNATPRVQRWINNSIEKQAEDHDKSTNFIKWLISQTKYYQADTLVLESYFAQDLLDHIASQLVEGPDSSVKVEEESEERADLIQALEILAEFTLQGGKGRYWEALKTIFSGKALGHYELGSRMLQKCMVVLPKAEINDVLVAMLLSLAEVVEKEEIDNNWLENELTEAILVAEKSEEALSETAHQAISKCIHAIGKSQLGILAIDFAKQFISNRHSDHQQTDCDAVIEGLVLVYEAIGSPNERIPYLDTLLEIIPTKEGDWQLRIIEKIEQLILKTDAGLVANGEEELEKLIAKDFGLSEIKARGNGWLAQLVVNVAGPVLKPRLKVLITLVENRLVDADDVADRIVQLLPYGGDTDRIEIALDSLVTLTERISITKGANLFPKINQNLAQFGQHAPKALILLARWYRSAEQSHQQQYFNFLLQEFSRQPLETLKAFQLLWEHLDSASIQQGLGAIYQNDSGDSDYVSHRDETTTLGVRQLLNIDGVSAIFSVWESHISKRPQGESFLHLVSREIDRKHLRELRQVAIDRAKSEQSSDSDTEISLKLLRATSKRHVADIMLIVELFENLLRKNENTARQALTYIKGCLPKYRLETRHKERLAVAMKDARETYTTISDEIENTATELGLKTWRYRSIWRAKSTD